MAARMDRVAETVALVTLRKVAASAGPPLQLEKLEKSFHARRPAVDSRLPMNDAVRAALDATAAVSHEQERKNWKARIEDAWSEAVKETVEVYFESAEDSFNQGEPMEGTETLTDAVRAALGYIAATREWPHSIDDHLYRLAAALASGRGWPNGLEEFDQALKNTSAEGMNLCAALCASMGRPDMLRFGVYEADPGGPQRDGVLFARTTIELANRLANQGAVPS